MRRYSQTTFIKQTFNRGLQVNKSELIDSIAQTAGISKAAAGRALDATTMAITKAMQQADVVTLIGFARFI